MKGQPPAGRDSSTLRVAVLSVVDQLHSGEVVSYGDIAALAGFPGAARAAGSVMADCPDTLPWWRVVYSDGHLPTCNPGLQAQRLADEGVLMSGFRVIASPRGRFAGNASSG